jgi:hypothetical protein
MRPRIAGVNQLSPCPRQSYQLRRTNHPPIRQRYGFALVQLPPERAFGNPELASPARIEAAQAGVLHQRVAHGIGSVLGFEDHDLVIVSS